MAASKTSRIVVEGLVRPSRFWTASRPCYGWRSSLAARHFNNTIPIVEADSLPPDPPVVTPLPNTPLPTQDASAATLSPDEMTPYQRALHSRSRIRQQFPPKPPLLPTTSKAQSPRFSRQRVPLDSTTQSQQPLRLTADLRKYLPYLASQPPYYLTIHIHEKPYLVTVGDAIRLPFLMHGVRPGDVLRLDRATILGSRDWTLRAGSINSPHSSAATAAQQPIIEPADGNEPNLEETDPNDSSLRLSRPKKDYKLGYLDPRLFVCRATVLGAESEPMRIIKKTKQRNRKVKTVMSRIRNTVLRISEITVVPLSRLEAEPEAETAAASAPAADTSEA